MLSWPDSAHSPLGAQVDHVMSPLPSGRLLATSSGRPSVSNSCCDSCAVWPSLVAVVVAAIAAAATTTTTTTIAVLVPSFMLALDPIEPLLRLRRRDTRAEREQAGGRQRARALVLLGAVDQEAPHQLR